MDERRRRERTDLEAQLKIKRADGTKIEEFEIDVTDISISGLGFTCAEELELGEIYDGVLTIWTKEKLNVFLDIVRRLEVGDKISYGAQFVGMPDLYKRKIGVYQTVENESKKQNNE